MYHKDDKIIVYTIKVIIRNDVYVHTHTHTHTIPVALWHLVKAQEILALIIVFSISITCPLTWMVWEVVLGWGVIIGF